MPDRSPSKPIHLRPQTDVAERVLLPGDPHRALAVAQALLEHPRMLNHHRGLWGYTGHADDGRPLTVQATGMGGPSAAIVVEELIGLGARELIRIGTCGALDDRLVLGGLVTVLDAIPADGTSLALGARERVLADAALTAALRRGAGEWAGTVASTDLFYERRQGRLAEWAAQGALCVEMEAATVLQAAALRGARAACVLAVSDVGLLGGERAARRIEPDALEEVGLRLGAVALRAFPAAKAGD